MFILSLFFYYNPNISKMAPASTTDSDSYSSSTTQPTEMSTMEYYDMKGEIMVIPQSPHHGGTRRRDSDTDSDKDLVITSLTESLQIHKEILERLNTEKEVFIADLRKERDEEQHSIQKEKEEAQSALEAQLDQYRRLETAYSSLVKELEAKKEEYKRMESSFYAHVKSIRPTDDDLSTIQYEITHLANQMNNFCMGLKSKMDRSGGSEYILERWPMTRAYFLQSSQQPSSDNSNKPKPSSEEDDNTTTGTSTIEQPRLETWIITMFTEKLVTEALTKDIFDQPIHIGVSVNETFKQLNTWIDERNTDWASRLRQQVSALVVRQAGEKEQAAIDQSLHSLVDRLLDELCHIYPRVKDGPQQRKKLEAICARAAKLNLAMKGQDIRVFCGSIEEGVALFDSTTMKPMTKCEPEGTVVFVVSPPFIALDPKDEDHGFVIPAKVYCTLNTPPSIISATTALSSSLLPSQQQPLSSPSIVSEK
ncbi:hypothetical protein BDA99DRAFT_492496 [Phascolomyces articulosus]|uniref:Uncharacterized protein n=1 Tax=Phascolomyces articulosus TaxID=60185 RepID=A0AAD5KCQ3_9FUNG|nr:hypothetical protein BDA99DRAFT_492496 [Phascolomyces articulosus]